VSNQAVSVPASSGWSLAALAGMVAAAGALLLRRRRRG
jgi:LPXTG-motif cell wall-anchored protein